MTQTKTFHIPLLKELRVRTAPMPLYFAHWRGLVENALTIRQSIAKDLKINLNQRECTHRGVQCIWGKIPIKPRDLLTPDRKGVEEWLREICTKLNQSIAGSIPIEHLQLCRTDKPHFLAYYASFYANYMEIVLYIDSGAKIDGADVTHLPRSYVDESTRDWKRLAEQLPLEIWIKEAL